METHLKHKPIQVGIPLIKVLLSFIVLQTQFSLSAQEVSPLQLIKDTKVGPFDCIFYQNIERKKILFTSHKSSTGFLVAPNIVLTAAHNVYSNGLSNVKSISLYPGRYQNTYAHDTLFIDKDQIKTSIKVHPKYKFSDAQRIRFDFAAIILNDNQIPKDWPKAFFELDSTYVLKAGDTIYVAGYPAETFKGTQLTTQFQKVKVIHQQSFEHQFDTEKGNSGSPIWVEKDGKRIVVGIHTFGEGATFLTKDYIAMIMKWAKGE